jgi:hypothetical protein
MADDEQLQFPPQRMARHDGEVVADVGADRAAADSAAICSDVGRCARQDWVASAGWAVFDWDAKQAAASRRQFLGSVADTGTLILPIHFPSPTVGRVTGDGERFRYAFVR